MSLSYKLQRKMEHLLFMNEPNFCRNLFLAALRHCLLQKILKNLKPLKNYVIKTIFSSDINFLIEVR